MYDGTGLDRISAKALRCAAVGSSGPDRHDLTPKTALERFPMPRIP